MSKRMVRKKRYTGPTHIIGKEAPEAPRTPEEALERECGECSACDRKTLCGWMQGLLGPLHRPDPWGMVLEGKELPSGKAVFVFREVFRNVRKASTVREVLSAVALHTPVVVAGVDGKVLNVMGPEGLVEEVVRGLGIGSVKVDGEVHEIELDHQPVNPLGVVEKEEGEASACKDGGE